jgi:hypothetical protein
MISTIFFLLIFSSWNAFCRSRRLLDEPICHNQGGLFGRKNLPGQFGRKRPGLMGENYLGIIARKMRIIRQIEIPRAQR